MDNFKLSETKVQTLKEWMNELNEIRLATTIALEEAAVRMKIYADSRRSERVFRVGEWVWLAITNLKLKRPCKKLEYKRIGPFKIIKRIGQVAYKLKLPSEFRIHPVFHVSLLSPARGSSVKFDSEPVALEDEVELKPQEVLASRHGESGTEYLIRWENLSELHNSWEGIDHVFFF